MSIPIELYDLDLNFPVHNRILKEIHVAFKVADIKSAVEGYEVLMPIYQPFAGYKCAIVDIDGQLVELIETTLSEREIWGG